MIGTLNPALQDRQGRPKRDISTIIHILNDLLCATPQYRRVLSAHAASTAAAARSAPAPMETDDATMAAATQMAAAAIQRKSTGKGGLPTLLLLRGDILAGLWFNPRTISREILYPKPPHPDYNNNQHNNPHHNPHHFLEKKKTSKWFPGIVERIPWWNKHQPTKELDESIVQ